MTLSREEFVAKYGPEVDAWIDEVVAAAPPPSPRVVEGVRRIFAPTVRALNAELVKSQ